MFHVVKCQVIICGGQMSLPVKFLRFGGQVSLVVKCPIVQNIIGGQMSMVVKCQYWSKVPSGQMSLVVKYLWWSKVTGGLMSYDQMSLVVKCLSSKEIKCPWRSYVNGQISEVKCLEIQCRNGQMWRIPYNLNLKTPKPMSPLCQALQSYTV